MSAHTRLLIVAGCLLATSAYLASTSRAEPTPVRESLAMCPMSISDWTGRRGEEFDAQTLEVLGVDDYINRLYVNKAGLPVGLYVGYYGSQRQGDTMHSPLNCLPGSGWTPVSFNRVTIDVPTEVPESGSPSVRPIEVNRYVIEKGLDRQLVLYWYQSRGRVVASEYWGKIYLVLDAIRTNRTDGALVRIISPIVTSEGDAEREAFEFARTLYPHLGKYLPS